MKINNLKNKAVLLFSLLILTFNISAQEKKNKNKFNFKLGYSRYSDTEFFFGNVFKDDLFDKIKKVGNLRFSSTYNINKFIGAGFYVGYSYYESMAPSPTGGYSWNGANSSGNAIMYGVNSIIHILPLFTEKEKIRLDVYCSLQFGGIQLFEPKEYINTKYSYSEYGIYGGIAFHPFRRMGLFAEYGYSKYANFRYGLSYKF